MTCLLNCKEKHLIIFIDEVDPTTGLIADKTQPGSPSSIAVVGMSLTTYIAGVERKFLKKEDAIERILKILRFFYNSAQGKRNKCYRLQRFLLSFFKNGNG